jgi:hypothetical protein
VLAPVGEPDPVEQLVSPARGVAPSTPSTSAGPRATFSVAVSCGIRLKFWNTIPKWTACRRAARRDTRTRWSPRGTNPSISPFR